MSQNISPILISLLISWLINISGLKGFSIQRSAVWFQSWDYFVLLHIENEIFCTCPVIEIPFMLSSTENRMLFLNESADAPVRRTGVLYRPTDPSRDPGLYTQYRRETWNTSQIIFVITWYMFPRQIVSVSPNLNMACSTYRFVSPGERKVGSHPYQDR